MGEAISPTQNEKPPDQVHGSQVNSNVGAEESKTNAKLATTDPARTAALKARKRTKTGCLTCRKRRIKCGEERPTCKNCVKSKRDCEGYVPRVIFKDPLGAFRSSAGAPQGIVARTHQSSTPNGVAGIYGTISSSSAEPPLAPRPSPYGPHTGFGPMPTAGGHPAPGEYYGTAGYTHDRQSYPASDFVPTHQYVPQGGNSNLGSQNGIKLEGFPKVHVDPVLYPNFQHHPIGNSNSSVKMGPPDLPASLSYSSVPSIPGTREYPATYAEVPMPSPNETYSGQLHVQPQWMTPHENLFTAVKPLPSPPSGEDYSGTAEGRVRDVIKRESFPQNQHYGLPASGTWIGLPDDDPYDPYDVDSDQEDATMKSPTTENSPSDLKLMIHLSANQYDSTFRTMTNFLNEPNVLATYHPSYTASPLKDRQTARVFCHFITATAPTLSVCERHPSNPGALIQGYPAPKSQQALWSYTLPMLALKHQALLHAMLALGSLHIAKLQQTSPTSSLKHYHYALRKVGKALGDQKQRRDVATLAATLLLGYYEVTTAEHNKWNSHLSGARELVAEIDFARMAKRIETYRCQQEEKEAKIKHRIRNGFANSYEQAYPQRFLDEFPSKSERQLDENLISTIMGWKTSYNQYGQIIDETEPVSGNDAPLTSEDINNFDIQSDLFWWYAKQDMYQSIISGNRLLLSYDRWGYCPPRAPVGRLNAVYGSMDHLYLLMARIADFAGKDRPRKRRAQIEVEARTQAMSNSTRPNPSRSSSQQGPSPTTPSQQPPFYGMMPDPGPVRLPRGFDQAQHDRIYTGPVPSEEKSLEAATREAEAEWAAISHAFDVLFESFGPEFAPLTPQEMAPIATPFGPAMFYRSYSIACVLNLYYCGRIICLRQHPSMPPASMTAIGVAAPQTARYAITVGRICAGIQHASNRGSLMPYHGAALMDCCMGLFHAGVQYQDPAQRGWTITRLREVARLTGFQTSSLIASGCESAWLRAAQMGRGPPYTRTINSVSRDERVAGRDTNDPAARVRPPKDNNDRRFMHMNAGTRVYWAMGILEMEEDLRGMTLNG